MSKKPIYILGTGLSHNGSVVLLKEGQICVAIEKERITRIKHDGGNDTAAIQYCLEAEGIQLSDVDLVVQCENFEIPSRDFFRGERLFKGNKEPKLISISHHLAHAYSAVGTSPFTSCNVMVIDGCGSPLEQYLLLYPNEKESIASDVFNSIQMKCEKDSFYHFDGQHMMPLFKDFSEMSDHSSSEIALPTTKHSIGGFYATISNYVFGNMDDVGKLMGLAPYGKSGVYDYEVFEFINDRLFVKEDWKTFLNQPSQGYTFFKEHFEYYANVAKWAQEQVEKAVLQCIKLRTKQFPHENLCYSGGVALNAVANAKLEDSNVANSIYFEPAASDNGLSLGCAFYGWLSYLKQPKKESNGSTCFGKHYSEEAILQAYEEYKPELKMIDLYGESKLLHYVAEALLRGKTIGWFQSGSEFGPRALGRRSILAHPGIENMKNRINASIKFREDFRPFAPAVLQEKVSDYFEVGRNSPYMILVDRTKKEHLENLKNVTHQDGSARVQTVEASWNPKFYNLIQTFYELSGIAVLLNTSFNKKGMPIVETPKEAFDLFRETALDVLVIENFVFLKN